MKKNTIRTCLGAVSLAFVSIPTSFAADLCVKKLEGIFTKNGDSGLRNIEFREDPRIPKAAAERGRDYLNKLMEPERVKIPPESQAFERLPPPLIINTKHVAYINPKNTDELIIEVSGGIIPYAGKTYADATNGSLVKTTDRAGKEHFILPYRMVRSDYKTKINLNDPLKRPAIDQYVSDEGQYELTFDADGNVASVKPGPPIFMSTENTIPTPGGGYVVEDMKTITSQHGKPEGYLTVIRKFKKNQDPKELTYRNGKVALDVDQNGFLVAKLDPKTKEPAFTYVSPLGKDVKNSQAYETKNAFQAFYRFNSEHPHGSLPSGYSLIRAEFPNKAAFDAYDSNLLLEHLAHPELLAQAKGAHPSEIEVYLTSDQIPFPAAEKLNSRVLKQGFGLGGSMIWERVDEAGNYFLADNAKFEGEELYGKIPDEQRTTFPIAPGSAEAKNFMHQLFYRIDRYGHQNRHYFGSTLRLSADLKKPLEIFSGDVSPVTADELGLNSSIVDLKDHVYKHGWAFWRSPKTNQLFVIISGGTSDASTMLYKFDPFKYNMEFAKNSPYRASGQVAAIRPRK